MSRAIAHLSVIGLALFAVLFNDTGIVAPLAADGRAAGGYLTSAAVDSAGQGGSSAFARAPVDTWFVSARADTVARVPLPHTVFPDRLRMHVISYVIQSGDTIFDVAARFGLSPQTVVWSNREAINDAPWLIRPGLELFILPVNGVYHTVRAGETAASIAATYDVSAATLFNEWNDIEVGQEPQEGQLIVVPNGVGEEIGWEPPPVYPSPGPASFSYGVCGGASVAGPGANGWFMLPAGSREVSGWRFHDPRNPTHIGLDYRCHLGDPIYATDSGVVSIAGWSGGYGILVELNHGNGFVTRYAHLNPGSLAVGCGHSVQQGDVIGRCGNTGWSSGPHLHFEIRHAGTPVDPEAYQPQ
jgi:hypothetical protein